MKLSEAKRLKAGQTIYAKGLYNADGTAMRGKVTSVQTWKTRPDEIRVKCKHGLRDTGSISERELDCFTRIEPAKKSLKDYTIYRGEAIRKPKKK